MPLRSKPLDRVLEKMDVGGVAHINEDSHAFRRTVRRVIFGQLTRRRVAENNDPPNQLRHETLPLTNTPADLGRPWYAVIWTQRWRAQDTRQ